MKSLRDMCWGVWNRDKEIIFGQIDWVILFIISFHSLEDVAAGIARNRPLLPCDIENICGTQDLFIRDKLDAVHLVLILSSQSKPPLFVGCVMAANA